MRRGAALIKKQHRHWPKHAPGAEIDAAMANFEVGTVKSLKGKANCADAYVHCLKEPLLAVTDVVMHYTHRWMHEKAYFLHKRHHKGFCSTSLVSLLGPELDLVDMIFEFGAGTPLLMACKWLFGLDPRLHFLSPTVVMMLSYQLHSGNPYSVYFFNPLLDYLGRASLCHNLHHAVQKGYYLVVPWPHFFDAEARQIDIHMYNKHMKTHFPSRV